MNVQTVTLPNSQVSLDIEVDSAAVGSAIDRAYRRLSQQVNVPGFRKGKAPRAVLEATIGRPAVLEEAADIAVNDAYRWALQETGLEPITNPEIDMQGNSIDPSQPLYFTAKVYTQPKVSLGDYQAIRVDPPKTPVSEDDVERVITSMAEREAPWEPVEEGGARSGDVVVLALKGTVGDETAMDEQSGEYLLNSDGPINSLLPGVVPHVEGLNAGETRDVELQLPEEYFRSEFSGKTMQLHLELQRIERKAAPVIDDAFAQSLGDFESLEALRQRVRESAEAQQRMTDAEQFVADVTRQAVDEASVEIPPPMVEDEIHRSLDNLRAEVEGRGGMSFDLYLRVLNKTAEELHEELREPSEARVKSNLVLEAIAGAEEITAPKAQVDAELRELSALPTVRERDRRRILTSPTVRARIETRLQRRLALQRLLEIANPKSDSADNESGENTTDDLALQEAAQSHAAALEGVAPRQDEEEM